MSYRKLDVTRAQVKRLTGRAKAHETMDSVDFVIRNECNEVRREELYAKRLHLELISRINNQRRSQGASVPSEVCWGMNG